MFILVLYMATMKRITRILLLSNTIQRGLNGYGQGDNQCLTGVRNAVRSANLEFNGQLERRGLAQLLSKAFKKLGAVFMQIVSILGTNHRIQYQDVQELGIFMPDLDPSLASVLASATEVVVSAQGTGFGTLAAYLMALAIDTVVNNIPQRSDNRIASSLITTSTTANSIATYSSTGKLLPTEFPTNITFTGRMIVCSTIPALPMSMHPTLSRSINPGTQFARIPLLIAIKSVTIGAWVGALKPGVWDTSLRPRIVKYRG